MLFFQTNTAKILWVFIVCFGFVTAGILISHSYYEWQENPIATSITTHPIKDLYFPIVTICPPRDSNTALYHDLVKAGNGTLSDEKRQILKSAAYKIFIEQPHKEYVKNMSENLNMRNLDQMYQGYHSLPKPYLNGFEIRMWNLNGTVTTPWYGGEFVEEYYTEDQDYHMVLEFPDDIQDQVGNGSLIIELDMDIREKEGWQEQLRYGGNGPRQDYFWSDLGFAYKVHEEKLPWPEAEAECQKEGGHLPSVTSEEKDKELKQVGSTIPGYGASFWLGGKQESGVLSWSDNSTWGFTNWRKAPKSYDFYLRMDNDGRGWSLRRSSSPYNHAFICQRPKQAAVRGRRKLNLKYKQEELDFPSFHVWYRYKAANHHNLLDNWEDKRMTGFRLSWRVEYLPLKENVTGVDSTYDISPNYTQPLLDDLVQLASFLRSKRDMTQEQLLNQVIQEKVQNISSLEKSGRCYMDSIKSDYVEILFPELVSFVDHGNLRQSITEEDIRTGLELFYAILYCPVMNIKLFRFVDQLLSFESSRTIIQTFVNIFRTGVIQNPRALASAKEFYMVLAATLNLQYGNVLLATSTRSQLQAVVDNDWPFFIDTSMVKTCLFNNDCDKSRSILQKLGKSKELYLSFIYR